jgi:hypothetical protein
VSWLYVQTWLWYLIAFVVGVLLAWAFFVRPQQRRLQPASGSDAPPAADAGDDRSRAGLAAAGAGAAATGAALFHAEPDSADRAAAAREAEIESETSSETARGHGEDDPRTPDEPVTEQISTVNPSLSTLDTNELPVQPHPDAETSTTEIPVVTEPAAGADAERADTAPHPTPQAAAEAPVSEPAVSEPAVSEPAVSEPAVSEPAVSEPAVSEPAVSELRSSTNGSTAAATTAAPADPAPAANGEARAARKPAAVDSVTAGPYPGSAVPGADGAAPGPEFTIKGNPDSMLFHTPDSPTYGRTKAEVWFSKPEDAEAAGFTNWTRTTR